jgi:predicted aldo/keto reductase-like oxidoreductase
MKHSIATFVFEVQDEGMVRYIPISAHSAVQAVNIMKMNGWTKFRLI